MSTIRVEEESESSRGWRFQIVIVDLLGIESRHLLRLSWADYDHWSHGATPPARVAEAAVRFLLDRGALVPERFDAATLRRRYQGFDDFMGGKP